MARIHEIKIGGRITDVKEKTRNGVKVGTVEGYIATFDVDRGSWGVKDQFMPGAFTKAIARHQKDGRPEG